MNSDPVAVSEIRWRRIFPLLHLLDAIKLTFRLRTIVPACLIAVLLPSTMQSPQALMGAFRRDFLSYFPIDFSFLPFANVLPKLIRLGTILPFPQISTAVLPTLAWLAIGLLTTAIAHSTGGAICLNQRVGSWRALIFSIKKTAALLTAFAVTLFVGVCLFLSSLLVQTVLQNCLPIDSQLNVAQLITIVNGIICLSCVVVSALATAAIAIDDCSPADAVSRSINYLSSHFGFTLIAICFISFMSLAVNAMLNTLQQHGIPPYLPDELSQLPSPTFLMRIVLINLHSISFAILYLLLRQKEDATRLTENGSLKSS